MARKTVAGCVERINQLYERVADTIRVGDYWERQPQTPCAKAGRTSEPALIPRSSEDDTRPTSTTAIGSEDCTSFFPLQGLTSVETTG